MSFFDKALKTGLSPLLCWTSRWVLLWL